MPETQMKIGELPGDKPVYRNAAGELLIRLTPTEQMPVTIDGGSLVSAGPVKPFDPNEFVTLVHP
jgi:hypothetical protein